MPSVITCLHCGEPIENVDVAHAKQIYVKLMECDTDRTYLHIECFMRCVFGSVGHQMKQCSCFLKEASNRIFIFGDPPGMTKRQAARAAYELAMRGGEET
jgi:hypothetical protein